MPIVRDCSGGSSRAKRRSERTSRASSTTISPRRSPASRSSPRPSRPSTKGKTKETSERIGQMAQESAEAVRRLIGNLRPLELTDGLAHATERLADIAGSRRGVPIEVRFHGSPKRLPRPRGGRRLPDRAGGAQQHRQACRTGPGRGRPPLPQRVRRDRDPRRGPRIRIAGDLVPRGETTWGSSG